MFENFVAETIDADGLPMFVRHAGAGPSVLLLHGHPRTSATWHRVAPDQEKPERVISADPDAWYQGDPVVMGEENYAEFRATMRNPEVVRGMLEDYRAGLTVDDCDERADRVAGKRLEQPVLVLWTLRDDLEQLYGRTSPATASTLAITSPSSRRPNSSRPSPLFSHPRVVEAIRHGYR